MKSSGNKATAKSPFYTILYRMWFRNTSRHMSPVHCEKHPLPETTARMGGSKHQHWWLCPGLEPGKIGCLLADGGLSRFENVQGLNKGWASRLLASPSCFFGGLGWLRHFSIICRFPNRDAWYLLSLWPLLFPLPLGRISGRPLWFQEGPQLGRVLKVEPRKTITSRSQHLMQLRIYMT